MQISKRMVLSCVFAVLALPLIGAVGDASAANLLVNSGFETGDLTGWEVYGETENSSAMIISDNGPAVPGMYCAFSDNQAEALALLIKQSTEAGSASEGVVDYSFDLKLGQAAEGGVFFVEIFAEMAGGGVIGGSGVLGNYTPGEWTTFTGTFTAPANTDFLTIQLAAITGAATGSMSSMSIDNVSLDQGTVQAEAATLSQIKALYR